MHHGTVTMLGIVRQCEHMNVHSGPTSSLHGRSRGCVEESILNTSSLAPQMMRVIVPGHCLVNSQRRKQFASKVIRSVACKIVESDVLHHREKC